MIRAKVLRRKHSKRLSKPDLKATFSDVCLVNTELRSNDLRIQEKPYIVYMCIVEISRDGCYFHQQNNDRIKANEDLDFCLCGGSEKSRFEWLHKEQF